MLRKMGVEWWTMMLGVWFVFKSKIMSVFNRFIQAIFYIGAFFVAFGSLFLLVTGEYNFKDFLLNIADAFIAFIIARDGKIVAFEKK